jgi:prepilin-type N-terminal cleavage/methylation domain-containing protein
MAQLHRSRGFTLVELLVVISIIMMIAGFGLVKMQGVWTDAKKTACEQNLKDIHAQLFRYQSAKGRLPSKSGSAFVMEVWGDPFVEKSVQNAKIFFCPSQPLPELTDATLEEQMTPANIHYAGRKQEKPYRFAMLDGKDASKTIICCDKPDIDGTPPHKGHCLCVLYANGSTGQILSADFGPEGILSIGPDSPVEALQGLEASDQ